jgi:hypothetical protein
MPEGPVGKWRASEKGMQSWVKRRACEWHGPGPAGRIAA